MPFRNKWPANELAPGVLVRNDEEEEQSVHKQVSAINFALSRGSQRKKRGPPYLEDTLRFPLAILAV